MVSIQASIIVLARLPYSLISSDIPIDSQTSHVIPLASIIALTDAISSTGQTSPGLRLCSAVTFPVAPACLICVREIGSSRPNQRQTGFTRRPTLAMLYSLECHWHQGAGQP